jgi:hypothetical protein
MVVTHILQTVIELAAQCNRATHSPTRITSDTMQ